MKTGNDEMKPRWFAWVHKEEPSSSSGEYLNPKIQFFFQMLPHVVFSSIPRSFFTLYNRATAYREENNVLFRKMLAWLLLWHDTWTRRALWCCSNSPTQGSICQIFRWDGLMNAVVLGNINTCKTGQVVFLIQWLCNCADGAAIRRMKLTEGHKKLWLYLTPERCSRNLGNVLVIL